MIKHDNTLKFRFKDAGTKDYIKSYLIKNNYIADYPGRENYHRTLKSLQGVKIPQQKRELNMKSIFKKLSVLSISIFITSCATKRDWHQAHYQNANAAHEAKVLCDSGQKQAALKLGYTCYPRDAQGNIIKPNTASSSSSYGNSNVIYINGNTGYSGANRAPSSYEAFGKVFQNLYNMERDNRIHSDKVRNGYYSKPEINTGR